MTLAQIWAGQALQDMRLVLVEFTEQAGVLRPYTLTVEGTKYGYLCHYDTDVTYCRRDDRLYFWESGSGPASSTIEIAADAYWAVDDVTIVFWCDPCPRLAELPAPYTTEELLGRAGGTDHCHYCSICDDDLPDDDPCDHIGWCERCGEWSTPSEPCGCPAEEEAV